MRIVTLLIVVLIALTASVSGHREVSVTKAPVTNALWKGENPNLPNPAPSPGIEGYCWPLSAAPGEVIAFYASGSGSHDVRFFRHTANAAGVRSIPMGTTTFVPVEQITNPIPWRKGSGWRISFSQRISKDWPSGIYSAQLTDLRGRTSHITFIVKPDPDLRSRLAVIANVNTWLAYNNWGGRSKYDGAAHVSFMRPDPSNSPVAEIAGNGHLTRGELWILGWLEAEGYQPDVYTDIDFDNGTVPSGYTYLVLSTHPEYWTVRMYDNLKTFLDRGGSLLYLGGNGIYEKGEYEFTRTNKGMRFRAGVDDGPREVALFRMLTPPKPERAILGVALERCGAQGAPYQVLQACHPLFRGTGLRNGDTFGRIGLNTGCGGSCGDGNGGACGWEIDTSDGVGARGIPTACNDTSPSVPAGPGLPSGLTVLARGQNWLESGVWKGAEMVYYRHPGGGFVFSVGSITFGGSLAVDRDIQQIVRNALTPGLCPTDCPVRVPAAIELGEHSPNPWRLVSTRPTGEALYRIDLTGQTFAKVCGINWYRIAPPSYFHDPLGRDACNPQISIAFSPKIRITRVDEAGDGPYRDLESFTTSPAQIRRIFFTPDELVFRAEPFLTNTYDLRFEFLVPPEGLCRIPTGP
jgi:hypothetical protein